MSKEALVIVDVQNDFCPGGKLAVPDGDLVVVPINRLINWARANGQFVLATRDWHPKDTIHFAKNGGLWPEHCVKETEGAKFHPDLFLDDGVEIISKGTRRDEDAYSAFEGQTRLGQNLADFLKQWRIGKLYIVGLATDYCVKATVLDALKRGFETYLLTDAIRAVDIKPEDGNEALRQMVKEGVKVTDSVTLSASSRG